MEKGDKYELEIMNQLLIQNFFIKVGPIKGLC